MSRWSIMGERIFHLAVPVREALAADDDTLVFFLSSANDIDQAGAIETAARLRTSLVIRLAQGHRWAPVGNECSNFDPSTGCCGHSREEMAESMGSRL
jgi:hypothetical protein